MEKEMNIILLFSILDSAFSPRPRISISISPDRLPKIWQARYTLSRQLENGEAARAASQTALNTNLRRRALIQQFKVEEAVQNKRTAAISAIRRTEEDRAMRCNKLNGDRIAQGKTERDSAEAALGQMQTQEGHQE